MMDSSRIVFANRRYAEIYGLTSEQVKPGTSLREVFEARAAIGSHGHLDRESSSVKALRGSALHTEVLELSDGRYISVVRRPMPGGGLLSTHEDITERAKLNTQLARQNALLKQREHELNARNEQLDLAMENMSQGLAMYDAEQRLIVCNSRYSQMYGLTAEQVKPGTTLRQIFDYRLQSGYYHVKDEEGFVGSWMGEFGEVSARTQELADGRIISVLRRRTANGGRVITHEDITERQRLQARLEQQNARLKEQEERLTSQNLQLDAALNNMLQGLAMYDGDYRLVICNRRYAEMYGLSPEQVKPGTPLREIIEQRIAHGEFHDKNADDLVRERMERVAGQRTAQYINELSDGRHIAVSTQPMAGGGTVTTHHDITEQRRSEAKIAHMALHDTLTGLPNRVLLNERLEGALRRVRRGDIVAMHLLDLDHFKTVNDTHGPSGRRQAARDGGRPAAVGAARDGHDRAHGRRRVRHRPDGHRATRRCHGVGTSRHRDRQRALRDRGASGGDRHQRRHRRGPVRRSGARPADPQRRSRTLPRQGRRPRHLSLLRARDGRADAGAPLAGDATCARR